MKEYEYKFVRVNKTENYQQVVLQHAKEGWRLVQVFAPGAGGLWAKENYCEIILEREISG